MSGEWLPLGEKERDVTRVGHTGGFWKDGSNPVFVT